MERSLVVIKPDGVQRGLVGRVIQRLEDAGLKIVAMKMVHVDEQFAKDHYFDIAERRGEQVFKYNVDFLTAGPVVAMVLEGVQAIESVRKIVGSTEPKAAAPGTIRGDFAHQSYQWSDQEQKVVKNLIHASSSPEDAQKETKLWFEDPEIHTYQTVHETHTF